MDRLILPAFGLAAGVGGFFVWQAHMKNRMQRELYDWSDDVPDYDSGFPHTMNDEPDWGVTSDMAMPYTHPQAKVKGGFGLNRGG